MKILFLTNNPITIPLSDWLNERESVFILYGKLTEYTINNIKPDFVVSYNYKHIIGEEVIGLMPDKIINLHTSYLPFNRGFDPNLWSIIEDSLKGVTIHRIDKGIDTGDILFQRKVDFNDDTTLKGSYNILHKEIQQMFKDTWEKVKEGKVFSLKQSKNTGSFHLKKELAEMKKTLDWNITMKQFKIAYENRK